MFPRLPFLFCFFTLATHLSLEAESAAISQVGLFKNIRVEDLANGAVLAERDSYNSFDRGMRVETCYWLPMPVAEAAKTIATWNPSSHENLGIYISVLLDRNGPANTEAFKLTTDRGPVKEFLKDTFQTFEGRQEFPATADEIRSFKEKKSSPGAELSPTSPHFVALAESFWRGMIKRRAEGFLAQGISGMPTPAGDKFSPLAREINLLLSEPQGLAARFAPLIPLQGLPAAPAQVFPYWQFLRADRTASVVLGCYIWDGNTQPGRMVDLQYYVSHTYYISSTLYELWPATTSKGRGTLVWRADCVSAPRFAWLKGVEAMAAGSIMLRSVRDVVAEFQKDISKK